MTAWVLLRTLTPLGWAVLVSAALILALIALPGLGVRWDPLGLSERRLKSAEGAATIAAADAAARRLEVEAARDQALRLDKVHQHAVAVERATVFATTQARSAHDADYPLDPLRAARLADHDRELCHLAPAVCAAAASDPAPGGDDRLHPAATAGGTDRSRL
jgi:hypothetical protein